MMRTSVRQCCSHDRVGYRSLVAGNDYNLTRTMLGLALCWLSVSFFAARRREPVPTQDPEKSRLEGTHELPSSSRGTEEMARCPPENEGRTYDQGRRGCIHVCASQGTRLVLGSCLTLHAPSCVHVLIPCRRVRERMPPPPPPHFFLVRVTHTPHHTTPSLLLLAATAVGSSGHAPVPLWCRCTA